MFTFKKALLPALAATAFAGFPLVQSGLQPTLAHAAAHHTHPLAASCANGNASHGDTTIGSAAPGPLVFPTGCNGPTGSNCLGPVVGVYGSSQAQNYVIQAAQDYCTSQLNGTNGFPSPVAPQNAIDIEYLTGGDSCPGNQWASNNPDQHVLGVTTVYGPTCTGLVNPYNPSAIADTIVGVLVEEGIAGCPGASVVQGGTPTVTSNFCQGSGTGATGSSTMCAPNNHSIDRAVQLWSGGLGNYAPIGGCNAGTKVQQRKPDAGDRVAWCANILGNPGLCNNTASQPVANKVADMFNDVCGNRFTGTGPLDGPNAIGYAGRGTILIDQRAPQNAPVPLADCGLISLAGATGWNANCDPTNPTVNDGFNNAETPPHIECNGDLQVITAQYAPWGYLHWNVNNTVASSGLAPSFVTWVVLHEIGGSGTVNSYSLDQAQGFMRQCQMNFQRTVDAGPLSGVTPTC